MRLVIISCGLLFGILTAQTPDEEFRVYTDHPRLLLTAPRLRLLKRERQRDSMRWRQFDLLVRGAAQMPEPGFAPALYFAVTGDSTFGKKAVDWALGPGADLRQLALVYDWCQPLLAPPQSQALAAKIHRLMEQRPSGLPAWRDRVLAAISTADSSQHPEEAVLRQAVRQWWRIEFAPGLANGSATVSLPDAYALLELLHAVRDNLKIDLRDAAPAYFRELPTFLVLGNYPAPLKEPQGEFYIPVYRGAGEPNLDQAALARAAGLSLVAFDNNALENQFLQGWLIQDRFLLRGTFGAPYEFLWANPYQPGLSYFQLPLLYHDQRSGTLFVRSSWEDDADWFGLYGGEAQLFHDGRITVLDQTQRAAASAKPVSVGNTSVIFGRTPLKFAIQGGTILVIGLSPRHKYLVETDDEEMREAASDRAGALLLEYPSPRNAGVRIHEESRGAVSKHGD